MIAHHLQRLAKRWRGSAARDARQTVKDRALAQRLYKTFEEEMEVAQLRGIHFYVQNGVVTLYGAIRHELDRELLVSFVRQIPGVKGVVEHLQIVGARFQDDAAELDAPSPR